MKGSPIAVWGTAFLMVTIVSCCSLVGVSIMPLISGPSYKTFITLFTGLAVGSLLGSATFSLIPQAFGLVKPDGDKAFLWKSLIIFFGIYLFYSSERLMRIYFDRRAQKKEEEQQMQLKKNKSSASIKDDDKNVRDSDVPTSSIDNKKREKEDELTEIDLDNNKDVDGQVTDRTPGNHHLHHHHHHHHHHDHELKPEEIITKALKSERGQLPNRRGQIAPVAWMIIIGDGLHNFIDGLSIGAAFSESVTLGISTSVAVIFEEFPHELGDFAVLISSGMSVRQALAFNFLSACTCYIGMVFGIILGDTTQSASFIFALAGGMFLYISLVDMMGEMADMLEEVKNSPKDTSQLLVMQNLGILSGILITFLLSLFGTT